VSKGGLYTGPEANKKRICVDLGEKVAKQNHKREQARLATSSGGVLGRRALADESRTYARDFPRMTDFGLQAGRCSLSLFVTAITSAAFFWAVFLAWAALLTGFVAAGKKTGR
jgi:hypothetical protein